jgi:hypothetical protein
MPPLMLAKPKSSVFWLCAETEAGRKKKIDRAMFAHFIM